MVLKAYGAQAHRHRPYAQPSRAFPMLHGGKLMRIDTGISQYYSGTLSWLEIAGGQ